jgi:large subunit ribosomal protein L35
MPKLKTRRSAAKRVRLTAKGKVRRAQAFRSHLMSHRRRKRKRQLRRKELVSRADQEQIKRLLPWG